MNAIELNGVCKRFRKVTLKKNYRTFKSFLLQTFRPSTTPAVNGKNGTQYREILQDVNLSVPKGKTWGIVGSNGCGKSTLLKLMAGIYRPDSGSINIDGRISALIELGAGFHPEFSGRENVFINASILGMSKATIEEKFDDIVAFAELRDFIDNPVRTYSSGMFMRLGFSIAVHSEPDVLLVDEVLAVGDEAFGHKCEERMESFKRAGKTIVIVTHDLALVEKWCDGASWIDKGKISMEGAPVRVVDAYLKTVSESENRASVEQSHEEPESDQSDRWGDREVEITSVTLFGSDGDERRVFDSGAEVNVTIEYTAHESVEDPVFGVGVFKKDGSQCYGTNTDLEGFSFGTIIGKSSIKVTFESLDLLDGPYTISVAVHAKDGYAYDYHDQMYEFAIRSKIKDVGVFRPPHNWSVDGKRLEPSTRKD